MDGSTITLTMGKIAPILIASRNDISMPPNAANTVFSRAFGSNNENTLIKVLYMIL